MNIVTIDFRRIVFLDKFFTDAHKRATRAIVFNRYFEFIVKIDDTWFSKNDNLGWIPTVRPQEGFVEVYDGRRITAQGEISANDNIVRNI